MITLDQPTRTFHLNTSKGSDDFSFFESRIESGEIRIPHFQRGLVWDLKKTANLLDSILKKVPFGKITFWETRAVLNEDRGVKGVILSPNGTEPSVYRYVLDGQQRITSLYRTLKANEDMHKKYRDLCVDITVDPNVLTLDSLVHVIKNTDNPKFVPVYKIFTGTYSDFITEVNPTSNEMNNLLAYKEKLKISIEYDSIQTEDQEIAANIFVAINNGSSRLTETDMMADILFDGLSNWYFYPKSEELKIETANKRFEIGAKKQLQLLALISDSGDYTVSSIFKLTPSFVIPNWQKFKQAIHRTIDYIKADFKIQKSNDLFAETIFNTLFYFFYLNNANPNIGQRKSIHKLVIAGGLSGSYKTSTLTTVKKDMLQIEAIVKNEPIEVSSPLRFFSLDEKQDILNMGAFKKVSNLPYFANCFLIILGMTDPKSIKNGLPIFNNSTERINFVERHHIFPKSTHGNNSDNIFNIMLLDSFSNNGIDNNHPSTYLTTENFHHDADFREILKGHFIGIDEITDIERNDLESFKRHRMTKIMEHIHLLFI